ncbi:MAG TPA: hypothetical protein VEI74_02720 [Candidatus Methylomirabilis sp.]|nr:hypothetical protein [Candidatus Methylomirabilis sp.]
MITYLYWLAVIAIAAFALWAIGARLKKRNVALATAAAVVVVGAVAYFFHYQQIFVQQYGGVMSITVPEGQRHIGMSWKEDNLWIENYDPAKNTCEFQEYSRGNLLQGKVILKNCSPLRQP